MVEITNKWAACIVYFNDSDSLENLINDLIEQDLPPSQIYVADNNSHIKPNSESLKKFNLINLSENTGFGFAANTAIDRAINDGFENLILFSQDVRLKQKNVTRELTNSSKLQNSILHPIMIDRKQNKIFSKGGGINFFTGRIYLFKKSQLKNAYWADGSCLAFSKTIYRTIGGFDKNYFMYFEDVDFCYRAKIAGYPIIEVPVEVSQTPNGPSALMRSRNSTYFAKKTKRFWFLLAVIKRNLFGAIKSLIFLDLSSAKDRILGIRLGLKLHDAK